MHSLYFVRVKQARDAEDAKQKAVAVLDDNGFAGGTAFFSYGKADWYVVGGRWSRFLTELTPEGKRAMADIAAFVKSDYPELEQGIDGVSYGKSELKQKKAEAEVRANALFEAATGFPFVRDQYLMLGYDDDARQLTSELLAALRAAASDTEVCLAGEQGIEGEGYLSDIQDEELVGSWLVAIDYHM
jgi:hypothetical protein